MPQLKTLDQSRAQLLSEYANWCANQGLPQIDPYILISDLDLTDSQQDWLMGFINRWEAQ